MVAELLSNALARAKDQTLSAGELLQIAGQLTAAGETASLSQLYQAWIETHPSDPLLPAIHFNHAVILSASGKLAEARQALETAVQINPDFIPPYINLGNVLERLGASGDAVQIWYKAANRLGLITGENANYKTTALKQIGRVLERYQIDEKAEEALKLSLEINPHQSDVVQHYVSLRQRQCKWPVIAPSGPITKEHLLKGISALSLAAHTDDPLMQLANAAHYTKTNIGQPKRLFNQGHQDLLKTAAPRRRRIGYLSSDLREHAVGFLTAEVYELHNRENVEVFLYYCGHESPDGMQQRIKAAADHWIDLGAMSDEQAAERMVADKIEILVDVNGYTNSARTKVLSMRPAPIIVNWLGFPGSLGNPSHHYIVADPFIIPPENEIYYSEKVLRLPCYQPNDRKRIIGPKPTRADQGLPEDAVVYCCFNGVHKITPFVWRRWMTILRKVPNSVLWLLDSIDSVSARLKEYAQQHGIAPERIIFARKAKNPEHLARYPLADLFLDTSPYGAHTTSSDALWMGVPVLTLAGRTFAARVCGSLVNSANLGDLVCHTPDEYVHLAIELGRDKQRLLMYRQRLAASKDTCVLFNMPLLVSSLERLYAEMWEDFKAGRLPRPDLANLDIYNDIGVELDSSDVELLAVPDYNGLYRQKLAERDAFSMVPPDARLWPRQAAPAATPPRPAPTAPSVTSSVMLPPVGASPQASAQADLAAQATAAAQSGQFELAARLAEQHVQAAPQDAKGLDLAARIMLLCGRADASEAYARRAIAAQPIVSYGLTLAEALKARGFLAGAESFFASVLQNTPNDERALIGMAEICEATDRADQARGFYQSALAVNPTNMAAAIKYSKLLPPDDLPKGLKALVRAKPDQSVSPKLQLVFLNHYVPYKEWADRAGRRLMPYHCSSLDELYFDAAAKDRDAYQRIAEEVLKQEPDHLDAIGGLAACLCSRGKLDESGAAFAKLAALRPGGIFDAVNFDPKFYARLQKVSDAALTKGLPPVETVVAQKFKKKPIVYLSCNYAYYQQFARPMLRSINAKSKGAQVHLHVMDTAAAEGQEIAAFCKGLKDIAVAVSTEYPGLAQGDLATARGYYHAIRMVRLYGHLKHYKQTLWLMDVDALVHNDLGPLFKSIGDADTAFRARPGRWEPWNQFNASVFAVAPTEGGLRYLRLIAAYVADFYQRGGLRWGIDQMAMYGAYAYLAKQGAAPMPYLLNDRAVDYEYNDDGFVWCNSGAVKFVQVEEIAKKSQKLGRVGYGKYLNSLQEYVAGL
ncbi:MAG: hypothetical protein JNK21_12700 [Rhodospirillaceae bacterium]|nr:hypothetical protein [Rhodospirillaceae bacterium]